MWGTCDYSKMLEEQQIQDQNVEMSGNSSMENGEIKKPKKIRKRTTSYTDRLVISKDNLPSSNVPIGYLDDDGLFIEMVAEERRIKMEPTKKEKAEARRISRKIYLNNPLNADKIAKDKNDEKAKEKRRLYSKKDSTKNRKKELAKEKRQVNKYLKEKDPDYYEKLIQKIRELDGTDAEPTSGTSSQ